MKKTIKIGNKVTFTTMCVFSGYSGVVIAESVNDSFVIRLDDAFPTVKGSLRDVVCHEVFLQKVIEPLTFSQLHEGQIAEIVSGACDFKGVKGIKHNNKFVLFPNATTGKGDFFTSTSPLRFAVCEGFPFNE
jgi:hypothetical protein